MPNLVNSPDPADVDYRVQQTLERAIDIYDKVFIRGDKPTERDVVALIAQALILEQTRVTQAIQAELVLRDLQAR